MNGFQMLCGFKVTPEDTLIILDEIQEIPKALTSLKYFYEQCPEYYIICAGSLLGIALHSGTSFPVGKVNFLNLYPLSFSEFLLALGKEEMANLILNENQDGILLSSFSENYKELLKYYFFIGGMPEVVSTWIETKDFTEVRNVQKEFYFPMKMIFQNTHQKKWLTRFVRFGNLFRVNLQKKIKNACIVL